LLDAAGRYSTTFVSFARVSWKKKSTPMTSFGLKQLLINQNNTTSERLEVCHEVADLDAAELAGMSVPIAATARAEATLERNCATVVHQRHAKRHAA
jgi:hypothetical protein